MIWGGLCRLFLKIIEEPYNRDVVIKILFIAGIPLKFLVIYVYLTYFLSIVPVQDSGAAALPSGAKFFLLKNKMCVRCAATKNKIAVKIITNHTQPFTNPGLGFLPTLCTAWHSKGSVVHGSRARAQGLSAGVRVLTTLASQRLNTENLNYAYLVGLYEGDGWFSVSCLAAQQGKKKGQYLLFEFGIELAIRDVQLIYKIKKLLGVGVVVFRKSKTREDTVFLRVRNKQHLINIILPIFDKYPFLSNKHYDFLRFKEALLSGIIFYKDLPQYERPIEPLNSIESILNIPYLIPWLVGFIEAEGCFSIYKQTNSNSLVASFDISQTNGHVLISAISKHLSFTQKVFVDKTNNSKLKVTSARSIENVILFLQNSPIKLKGYKKLQYLLWLKKLRTISRYNTKFQIPNKY